MPIIIRMTNCPHLSGPRAFLECKTLRAVTEKVQGKPGQAVHPSCTVLHILYKLISQWLHNSPSSRWVMVFLPNPLLLETRLFPVLHVYKSTVLIASWIKSCSYSFSEVPLLASFQAQNAHCPSIFQKSLEQHDLPSTTEPRSTPEHSPGALGSHSPIFAAESPSC